MEEGRPSVDAATWLTNLRWEQVPPKVATHNKHRILDAVGVMLAASAMDIVTRARKAAIEESGRYRILGSSDRASLPAAAFANGVLGAVLEFDDTHTESSIHVTTPTVSVAFPYCEAHGLSGKQLILGVLGGGELTCRLGLIGPHTHALGLHATGLYGTFGAAYALAKLRELSVEETVSALGIAGSMAAGSRAGWDEGTDAKSMQVGIAAAAGARAVSLASHKVTGPASVFDSPTGFFRSHFQAKDTTFHYERLTAALGENWESLRIASKAYPTGYFSHPFIEAALILRSQHEIDLDGVERITCFGPDRMDETRRGRDAKLRPRTSWHARISLYHQVAEALVVGKIDKTSFSEAHLHDSRINALADKVYLELDKVFNDATRSGGRLLISLQDGRQLSYTVDNMRGTARNPISEADYVAKFRANVEGVLAPAVSEQIIADLLQLERLDDVSPVLRRLSH